MNSRDIHSDSNSREYAWDELAAAPEEPGLYAWYLNPDLRVADLNSKSATIENIGTLAKQLRIPDMEVTADGHLSLQLSGHLNHKHVGHEADDAVSALIDDVLSTDGGRRLFAQIFGAARPCFMSPLYIGVTINLRERIADHRIAIEREQQRAALGIGSEDMAVQSFARQVWIRQIPWRRLFVHVLPLKSLCDPSTTPDMQRRVAEAVETLLNRLFYPVLGRR